MPRGDARKTTTVTITTTSIADTSSSCDPFGNRSTEIAATSLVELQGIGKLRMWENSGKAE